MWGGPHRGIPTLVSAPPLGRVLRLVQTPQSCWRICCLLPLTGRDLSVLPLVPCLAPAQVCVWEGGAQWEGRGRRPIGQVHPQGTWHRVAEEMSGLQQGEAKPSDEERPSHRCGCLVLGAASGRRAFPAGEGTRGAARREPAGAERAWTRKPWAESAQVT